MAGISFQVLTVAKGEGEHLADAKPTRRGIAGRTIHVSRSAQVTRRNCGVINDNKWPSHDDISFSGDVNEDWLSNACVNVSDWEPVLPYAEGYKRAGEVALECVLEHGCDQDYLV
ncbi:MAG: hypothetical protein Q8Q12_08880 [bacterium]|nr:hypothetical protein [bacterium]